MKKGSVSSKKSELSSVEHLLDTVLEFAAGCGYLRPGSGFLQPDYGQKWPSKSESSECGKQPWPFSEKRPVPTKCGRTQKNFTVHKKTYQNLIGRKFVLQKKL